ncbi:MAG: hypothetical protein ABFQ53_00810 [Patescibacteria group bacterium]
MRETLKFITSLVLYAVMSGCVFVVPFVALVAFIFSCCYEKEFLTVFIEFLKFALPLIVFAGLFSTLKDSLLLRKFIISGLALFIFLKVISCSMTFIGVILSDGFFTALGNTQVFNEFMAIALLVGSSLILIKAIDET